MPKPSSPERQLETFIARFTPEIAAMARASLAKMRKRCPSAQMMVYDNYRGLVVGFVPNERPSDVIFSIAIYAGNISLCFLQGAKLPDPKKMLRGSGTTARHIRLESAATLDEPDVKAMMKLAMERARVPFDPKMKATLVIRSVSAKQLPRRPAKSKG